MLRPSSAQGGFTLVELIIAMAMFSFGLLVIVAGFLALLGFYQHGTATRIVQNAARVGINEIVLAGRSANWFAYDDTGTGTVCIAGPTSSIFFINVSGTTRELRKADWASNTACTFTSGTSSLVTSGDVQAVALLPEQTGNFDPTTNNTTPCTAAPCTQLSNLRVSLRMTSAYDQLDDTANRTICKSTAPSFCTVTTLSTTMTAGGGQ